MFNRADTGGKTGKNQSFEEIKVLHEEVIARQVWDFSCSNILGHSNAIGKSTAKGIYKCRVLS